MDEPINVLLAEDNESEIELACIALKKRNISGVYIVRDGAEALDFLLCKGRYATRNPNCLPKVVVLDINMPKVSGLAALEHIRSNEHIQHLPVVILTNSNHLSDMETAHQWKVNCYVRKPYDFQEFVTLLGDTLEQWI